MLYCNLSSVLVNYEIHGNNKALTPLIQPDDNILSRALCVRSNVLRFTAASFPSSGEASHRGNKEKLSK